MRKKRDRAELVMVLAASWLAGIGKDPKSIVGAVQEAVDKVVDLRERLGRFTEMSIELYPDERESASKRGPSC